MLSATISLSIHELTSFNLISAWTIGSSIILRPLLNNAGRTILIRPPIILIRSPTLPSLGIPLPQRRQPLLLSKSIDISADDEADEVEEGRPELLREEGLRESQRQRGCDPGDFHDGHEAGADRRADLVEGAGACDDGHEEEVDDVLNG